MLLLGEQVRVCRDVGRQAAVAVFVLGLAGAARPVDQVFKAPAPIALPSGPQTLTGVWFGQGPALRDAGFDFYARLGSYMCF